MGYRTDLDTAVRSLRESQINKIQDRGAQIGEEDTKRVLITPPAPSPPMECAGP
jgi:hypothetical protein